MSRDIHATIEDSGKRLDKFLVEKDRSLTRGEIIRMIKSGAVEVNGKKAKPSHTIHGDEYIFIGAYRDKSKDILPNRNLVIDVVEGTENFIVINKQRGLQVHPSHRERYETLVNALLARFPEIVGVGEDEERPGIVHRLDKDTTGLIIVARNQKSFADLKELFSQRKLQKTYYALVFGFFAEKKGVIDAPIARATSYTKQKIAFGKYKGDARDAVTEYEVVKEYTLANGTELSLVKVLPKTGRTHQIRVHMAHSGHPLLGDERYYTKNEKRMQITIPGIYEPHTFYLHAKEISFSLYGKSYHYAVDYPDRFGALLHYLHSFER
jgi:23S rRNA pseudouridine1911/1915/1917 synthase